MGAEDSPNLFSPHYYFVLDPPLVETNVAIAIYYVLPKKKKKREREHILRAETAQTTKLKSTSQKKEGKRKNQLTAATTIGCTLVLAAGVEQ